MQTVKKIRTFLNRSKIKPVFVIGTGRSGTHWLGYTLENNPEIEVTIEDEPVFSLVTKMAMDPSLEVTLFPQLEEMYRKKIVECYPRFYIDKSHPNIWLAERLKKAFPKALFIGIERNPYATVASMMQHKGVAQWHKTWRNYPVPNRFLGITKELAVKYEAYSLPTKCALRWRAHHGKFKELNEILGDSLMMINYEEFALDPAGTVDSMTTFLKLKNKLNVPHVKIESLSKWKNFLTKKDIEDIKMIVGFLPVF